MADFSKPDISDRLLDAQATDTLYEPDLLTNQLRRPRIILPLPEEYLSEEGIEGLLLVSVLLAPARVLLFEGGQEPLQHEHRPLLRVGLLRRGCEHGRVFAPIGAELCQAGGREDEWGSGETREIAIERGDRLEKKRLAGQRDSPGTEPRARDGFTP